MNTILEKINSKPSVALQFMVDGLKDAKNQPNCQVDMSTFGSRIGNICIKCAATCTIERIFGKVFNAEEIGNRCLRFKVSTNTNNDYDVLYHFESVMDDARLGYLNNLFKFCGLSDYCGEGNDKFQLHTDNWETELPKVKLVIEELKAAGY